MSIRTNAKDTPVNNYFSTQKPYKNSLDFIRQIKNLLEEGYQQGYSKEYVTQSILEEMQANPKMARQMGFPQTLEAVKQQITGPYWVNEELKSTKPVQEVNQNSEGDPVKEKLSKPHLEFETQTGLLSFVDGQGHTYWQKQALSGNASGRLSAKNNGALPPGFYDLAGKTRNRESSGQSTNPFKDKTGHAWSQVLIPEFKTSRSALLIHPDGNVKGTAGCVGLEEADTSDVKKFLDEWYQQTGEKLVLWVRP
ncbi:MAG: hypothetical protein ACD_73C00032G0003 [uncultured bacterium]|nr:MAG: hypothetical protein ACD_73C00032G0003 [uncultured bacterium]